MCISRSFMSIFFASNRPHSTNGILGDLFALCPYDPTANSVEAVLDSSRYFVLKVEDHGRHAFIGMGFQERTEAFDFNVTLQDFFKFVSLFYFRSFTIFVI
ncbi:hypothetical protein BC936DRAFT_142802 [Jimgerdemannia flammicorona]|uniref:NECAP PHear domain-containing protein n=1 Tax=Jimgerdemannia flammicorona TaxID=994334 RepID=A0A432ZZW2_9FUNG|nr:hypothetical protein BC936DRAFT_142802 [Jimgerdemannia flammicorona]